MKVVRPVLPVVCVALVAAVVSILVPSSAQAQWPLYPDRDAPRTDGDVDLDAPAPRTADGHPDLSGVWRGVGSFGRGQSTPDDPGTPPRAGFLNVGANVEGGLPFTPLGAELLAQRRADNSKDNPEAHCLPMGLMQFHTQGAPRKIIQTPALLVILYEASMGMRQVFTDGRARPPADVQPWWYGYSRGRWEGDELVVETTNLVDGGWLDIWGTPRTDAATITERFRRPNYGRMEIDITVDDAKAYTRPWTVRVDQQLIVDEELIEFVCLENQRFGAPPPDPQ